MLQAKSSCSNMLKLKQEYCGQCDGTKESAFTPSRFPFLLRCGLGATTSRVSPSPQPEESEESPFVIHQLPAINTSFRKPPLPEPLMEPIVSLGRQGAVCSLSCTGVGTIRDSHLGREESDGLGHPQQHTSGPNRPHT